METVKVHARLRFMRISVKKVRIVLRAISGMNVDEAQAQLTMMNKRSTGPIAKLLASAVANATNNFNLDKSSLRIAQIMADKGPMLKRWRARARGVAAPIRKHMSHIHIILEGTPVATPEKKGAKASEATPKSSEEKKAKSTKTTKAPAKVKKEAKTA